MTPDLSVLDEHWQIDPTSIEPVTEGVWWGKRIPDEHSLEDVTHGVWWTHDGQYAVSLAEGTGLHWNDVYDYETYGFRHPGETCGGVCCHETREAAERCALGWMRTGQWCGSGYGTEPA